MEKKIRGGALIARALKEKGIDKVFTLSGGFCNPAIEGFMECQMDDGTIVVITNCDEGRRQALADRRNVFVYEAAEAAKILRKIYGQETIRQVFQEFPGAKIKNVKIKGDLNDDLPF